MAEFALPLALSAWRGLATPDHLAATYQTLRVPFPCLYVSLRVISESPALSDNEKNSIEVCCRHFTSNSLFLLDRTPPRHYCSCLQGLVKGLVECVDNKSEECSGSRCPAV